MLQFPAKRAEMERDLQGCIAQSAPGDLHETVSNAQIKGYWPQIFESKARHQLIPECMQQKGWQLHKVSTTTWP
jgi:hypothetical protein